MFLDGAWYGHLSSLAHSLNVPSNQPIPVKMTLNSLCIFIVSNLLTLLSATLIVQILKQSGMFKQLLVVPTLLLLVLFFS